MSAPAARSPARRPGPGAPARVALSGSEHLSLPGAERLGPAPGSERIVVTVAVRRPALAAVDTAELGRRPPRERTFERHPRLAQVYRAETADLARVEAFGHAHGLRVGRANAERGTVALAGRAADVARAFGVELAEYDHPRGRYRGLEGAIELPRELDGVVTGVFGLDGRLRRLNTEHAGRHGGAKHHLTPVDIARHYSFPEELTGAGQCVAILRLGGAYRPADLRSYFRGLRLPVPELSRVGLINDPNPQAAMLETALDVEVAAAIAPGARFVVYFAPGQTEHDLVKLVDSAVYDRRNRPSVISISWGGAEATWTKSFMRHVDGLFKYAALLGVTVCVASGDDGSVDTSGDVPGTRAHVDFPASSPHALACGGTVVAPRQAERVWNSEGMASGGGISAVFPVPAWQRKAGVPPSVNPGHRKGRGVPDVAGHAKFNILYRGRRNPHVVGTSGVAPLWAGLVALLNEGLGRRVGYLNPYLYAHEDRLRGTALRDVRQGTNAVAYEVDAYHANDGWDPCTGLGRPDGAALLAALRE